MSAVDWSPYVYCPPLVRLRGVDAGGFLLAWVQHERDRSWHAIVAWTRKRDDWHERLVVDVPSGGVEPLHAPDAYHAVPRLLLGRDGTVRPWEPPPPDPP